MKDFFKPEDFSGTGGVIPEIAEIMSGIANEKLNALIKSWPVVYIDPSDKIVISDLQGPKDTHKARLSFIEEIVKEPCKHEPQDLHTYGPRIYCKHCGVELIADWKAK